MEAARGGDRPALDALLRRHYDRIYALCRRVCGNDADGADACQEAMIAIVRGLNRFDGRSAFSTWAYRVATNAALDELRRRRRRPDPGLPDTELEHDRSGSGSVGSPAETVAAQVDVSAALAKLPAEYRVAVVLRDLCQLSYEEIGDVLGVPPGTVRSRIARGRAALVPHLASEPGKRGEARNRRSPGDRPNPRRP